MIIITLSILMFLVVGSAALLVDHSRSEAARLRLLVELSERLQLSPTIEDAASVLPSFGSRLFPRLEGAVYVNRTTGGSMKLAVAWGNACEEEALHSSECNALLLGTTHVTGESICEHSLTNPDAATICVPMLDAGEPFGLLVLRASGATPLPPGIVQLARPFAHQVALALSNLRLQETLRSAAVRDSLTGLYNRRCIAESLTVELLGGGDPNARVGVILIDVDHFKRFNDTWGHGGGDALLKQLALVMQEMFAGQDDIVCRYGGEEFLIVLPDITPEVLRTRAQQLLERVRGVQIECNGRLVSGITISAGIAISPNHSTNIEGLIAAADRALYTAKSGGRDRLATPRPQVVARSAA
jgi:diguanylate cyclase (GGDEF)-like protein